MRMRSLPGSYYLHRHGHESYWVRFSRDECPSLVAMQVLVPYFHLIEERDLDYMLGRRNRLVWFSKLDRRPIRLKRSGVSDEARISVGAKLRQFARTALGSFK
jgi:hypothetical protein